MTKAQVKAKIDAKLGKIAKLKKEIDATKIEIAALKETAKKIK